MLEKKIFQNCDECNIVEAFNQSNQLLLDSLLIRVKGSFNKFRIMPNDSFVGFFDLISDYFDDVMEFYPLLDYTEWVNLKKSIRNYFVVERVGVCDGDTFK